MHVFPFHSSSSYARKNFALDAEEREQLTGFLRRLVQTPSHPTEEGDVAALVAQELRNVGVEDVRVDRAGNVIGRVGSGEGPQILFDAHMDTVIPSETGWAHDPYAADVENGILYGLGACDMKGALAAMVYAAKRLVDAQIELKGTAVFAFVVQEEPCEGCALRDYVEEAGVRPDWVVLGEPSNLRIMRGHRGRVMFRITVHGKSSHASSPHLGQNAIAAAARLVFGIDLEAGELGNDAFLGPGTVAVTHIASQAPSLNAIPDTCVLYVDRRLTAGETPTRAQSQIETVIQREGIDADVEIVAYSAQSYTGHELHTREAFNAWVLGEDHPLLKAARSAVQQVEGLEVSVGHWTFSTDGVYSMGEAQIPTVGLGPGDPELAHTVRECVPLKAVAQAAEVYARMAALMLG